MAGGRLTTHVLDTATGRPAAGLRLQLKVWRSDQWSKISEAITNDDGRCNAPLLEGEAMAAGTYELMFDAGDYLRTTAAKLTDPAFLDQIPIRFAISDANAHYHVPLLLSPYGYSTYRGS